MTAPGRPTSWLLELRRRGVLRVAASYGAIAWLLVQIGGTVSEPLEWPHWAMKALIWTTLLGFPVACTLAWFLEFTPTGVAVDHAAVGAARPVTSGLRRYADLIVIGILLAVVGYLVAREPGVVGIQAHPTIAVLPFEHLGSSRDGEVLALGIAESVLHQLSNLQQLDVISRTSSFALGDAKTGAREIGEKLQATYLLEGSVQSDRQRMRVTTQLIDARTGADVWSMRFDRRPTDVFAVQDEIALQVTRALELVLDAGSIEHMKGQGTTNLEAYLAYVQGRALLASDRVVEVKQALEPLQRAVDLDPKFANAYVALAEAGMFIAEYDITEDREARFRKALDDGAKLVNRAIELEPDNGNAYIARAGIVAYADLGVAEADYRRGLDLNPNSAKGYAGLATLIYENPQRRQEALALLEHARKLDPLQPGYGVTLAVFQSYELGDMRAANATLLEVVRQHPDYLPALLRLMELRRNCLGELATAIEVGEHALELDPNSEEARRELAGAYLDLDEEATAAQVIDEADNELPLRSIPLLLYRHDYEAAGEAAYGAIEDGLISPMDRANVVTAIRMHARLTRDFERGRRALQSISNIEWDGTGQPHLDARPSMREVEIGLADVLLLEGRTAEGRALLTAVLDRYHDEVEKERRSEFWYRPWFPIALVLAGERDAAVAMLGRYVASRQNPGQWRSPFDAEPTLEPLRSDPRFQVLRQKAHDLITEERRKFGRLRADGRIPDRTGTSDAR